MPSKVQGLQSRSGYMEPAGYQQVSTLTSSTGLPSVPVGTTLAVIQAETQNVRYRDDGTAPTASVGMILVAGDMLYYTGNMADIKFIQVTASAKLNITYYR